MNDQLDVSDTPVQLIYDGNCPFCVAYTSRVKRYSGVESITITDAHDTALNSKSTIQLISDQGLDLDEGIVLRINDKFYHGPLALHILSSMSGQHGWFNRLNKAIFGSALVARIIYPVLKAIRNLTLAILGKPRIKPNTK